MISLLRSCNMIVLHSVRKTHTYI